MKHINILKFVFLIMIGIFAVEIPAISCPAQIPQAIITGNNSLNRLELDWNTKVKNLQIGTNQYTVMASFIKKPGSQGNYPTLTLGGSMAYNHIDNINCSPSTDNPTRCNCKREWYHNGVWEVIADIVLHQQ